MNNNMNLDRIDLKILDDLQKNGRISFQHLSELVNLTPRPCLERVRRLEKCGVIKGYAAIVQLPNPPTLMVIHAQIAMADHTVSQQLFTQELLTNPAVLDSWLTSGSYDFLVRIGCREISQYVALADGWLSSTIFKINKITTITELQQIKRAAMQQPALT